MPLTAQIKNLAEKIVKSHPGDKALARTVRTRRASTYKFADDGIVPNNPRWPLIVYRGVIDVSNRNFKAGAVIDAVFGANGWGRSWRDTVYDFVHYHSQVHEVLGVARGTATIELGGIKGRKFNVKPGDVLILPAGTGHRLIESSRGFLVVGAYPKEGAYDECSDSRDHSEAIKRIAKARKPTIDPIYGRSGPLLQLWSTSKRRAHR